MSAKELFESGNLSGAVELATQDVKNNPRDLKSRIFLFELLCFAGDFQRAGRQLDAVAQISGDVKTEMGAQAYQSLVQAETLRRGFFTGTYKTPKFVCEPPLYTSLHIDATGKLRGNELEAMERLLEESRGRQNPISGQCNGNSFNAFHDGDDLIGPFLEILFQSDYYWLPFEQIGRLEIKAPTTLRDLLWTPARVELRDRPLGDVFVPTQYFGSHEHVDDRIKLGRMTDWKSVGSETLLGTGQRTFFADETEYPLLEIRNIEFASQS